MFHQGFVRTSICVVTLLITTEAGNGECVYWVSRVACKDLIKLDIAEFLFLAVCRFMAFYAAPMANYFRFLVATVVFKGGS